MSTLDERSSIRMDAVREVLRVQLRAKMTTESVSFRKLGEILGCSSHTVYRLIPSQPPGRYYEPTSLNHVMLAMTWLDIPLAALEPELEQRATGIGDVISAISRLDVPCREKRLLRDVVQATHQSLRLSAENEENRE